MVITTFSVLVNEQKYQCFFSQLVLLQCLKSLYLLQIEISIIIDYIAAFINLNWLDLLQKEVSTILDSIGAGKVLPILKLSQTKVSMFLESIGALTMLKELYLL